MHNPFHIQGDEKHRLDVTGKRLRRSLLEWYEENQVPNINPLYDLTMGMLGSVGNAKDSLELAHPGCEASLKASETGHLVNWVLDMLRTHGDGVPFINDLVAAGEHALEFWRLLHTAPAVVLVQLCQKLMVHVLASVCHYSAAKLAHTTKLHAIIHLAHRTGILCEHKYVHTSKVSNCGVFLLYVHIIYIYIHGYGGMEILCAMLLSQTRL